MGAPRAKKEPKILEKFSDKRIDNYYYLNDRDSEYVLDHLKEENKYTDYIMADTKDLQDKLYTEIKGKIKQDDESVPYLFDGYYYKSKTDIGDEYTKYYRQKEGSVDWELLLDVNKLATNHEFYNLGTLKVSNDNNIIGYSEDTLSRRIYTIRFRDIASGKYLDDIIESVSPSFVWSSCDKYIFYTKKDSDLREFQIWRHEMGTTQDRDVLIYEELDKTFYVGVFLTRSRDYIVIGSSSTLVTEFRYIRSNEPLGDFKVFQERLPNHEYGIDHLGDSWYIITNKDGAKNFKLTKTRLDDTNISSWVNIVPHRESVLLDGFELFDDYIVLLETEMAMNYIRIINIGDGSDHRIEFNEDLYSVGLSTNPNHDTTKLRVGYTSMTTPYEILEYDMSDKSMKLLKSIEILGDFDKSNYITFRKYITSRDGVQIPISVVHHKDTKLTPNTPILQYGYGSYGISMDVGFSVSRLSLLDRGFVYVIAHIRGGSELGRDWYDTGKMLLKKNTFNDFIDVSKYMINESWTNSSHLYVMGGSAGGLLMGAIANMASGLYNGIISIVPFVDTLTTMLDDTIPLTTFEYDEWGNPNIKEYYDYIKSYSPYDNLEPKEYPNILIITGLHDSQVQYYEPAKYIQKLRDVKRDKNISIMKIDLDAGHGGASGRFKSIKDTAFEYSFLLKLEGVYM